MAELAGLPAPKAVQENAQKTAPRVAKSSHIASRQVIDPAHGAYHSMTLFAGGGPVEIITRSHSAARLLITVEVLEEKKPMPWPTDPANTWIAHGLECALIATPSMPIPSGAYNGYVRVPPEHPDAGKHYDDIIDDISVHGGLTFSKTVEDGSTWFGWDDCHIDRCDRPAEQETEELARQLAARFERKP